MRHTWVVHQADNDVYSEKRAAHAKIRGKPSFEPWSPASEELLKTLNDQGGDAVAALRVKLSGNISTAKQQINVLGEALDSISRETAEQTRGFVSRRPWTTVALGIVLGVAVGTAFATVGSGRR